MTKNRWWTALVALLLLTLITGVTVHAGGSFQAVLYAEQMTGTGMQGFLYVVSESAIEQIISVPASIYPAGNFDMVEVSVSPDLRYGAFSMINPDTYTAYPVLVADLTLQTCCQFLEMGLAELQANDLGSFDPSGRYLAYSRVGQTVGGEFMQVGELVMLDTQTGMFTVTSAPDLLSGQGVWALMGTWEEDGIRLHPNCYACEGAIEGEWWIWNPLIGTIAMSSGESFSIFGATLPATGETVLFNEVMTFPYSSEPSMFGRPNVIQLFTGAIPTFGNEAARDAAPVVFFDPANIDLTDGETVTWINDGSRFLVSNPNSTTWTIVERGGATQQFEIPLGTTVLTGTTNGWLAAQSVGGGALILSYTLQSGVYIQQVISQVSGNFLVATEAPLGAGLSIPPAPFATVAPQGATQPPTSGTGFVCEGVQVAPRLALNSTGRVTPGAPNNLRSAPSRSGSLLGQIPGGGMFLVLSDPICAEGFIWRQVNYNGTIGYTVEGTGSEYYVEPAG